MGRAEEGSEVDEEDPEVDSEVTIEEGAKAIGEEGEAA